MRSLDRKIVREIWRLRGQVLAIAVVIASGVAVLVMSLSTLEALTETVDAYYERYRFGDVFANAERVPERVADRVSDIPGVQFVQTRITRYATLDIEGFVEPVIGRLVSIPEDGQPRLNQLVLRAGHWIRRDHHDEVVLNEPFAEAHGLEPGDRFSAVINGHRRSLVVAGVALSPEFIYSLGPGSLLPDDRRYGVIWMGREALAAAFDLEHAFNDLSATLLRGVDPEPVLERIDRLLAPYGGFRAMARADQLSNWFVMNEIEQIKTLASVLPALFLAVAAFLSHMVLARLIATERGEIGLLKAYGYTNLEVGWHYTKFVIAVAVIGCLLGFVLGALFGRYNVQQYAEFFRFPLLIYRPSPVAFLVAGGISVVATLAGALGAARRAALLPPATAMQPPSPPLYRHGRLADSRWLAWLDQPTRIALRQIGRWPVRSALTSFGIALSVALLITALQWSDAIDHVARTYFFEAQHQTVSIGLAELAPTTIVNEFENLPGVLKAEPARIVAADFSVGQRRHRGAIIGIVDDVELQPIHDDATDRKVPVPPSGLVIGTQLADKLGVGIGDSIWTEAFEGRRPSGYLPVVAVFDTTIGLPAHMSFDALNHWLGERPMGRHVNLLTDPREEGALFEELKGLPAVSAVMLRQAAIDAFYGTLAEHIMVFIVIFTGFAGALAFGVAYNSTRIALSERGRELATLRVLGFTRGEISYILLGEVGLVILAALPLGCILGYFLAMWLTRALDTELFRIPFIIAGSTYGFSILFALIATGASAELVRRRVSRLDLVRVLKTRE